MSKTTCILIVNYNGVEDTIECIESLHKLEASNYFVCIVDNSNNDYSWDTLNTYLTSKAQPYNTFKRNASNNYLNSTEQIELCFSGYNLFRTENKGFAAANNHVLNILTKLNFKGYVWMLNNDIVVRNNTLSLLQKSIEQDKNTGIAGNTLVYYKTPTIVQGLGGSYNRIWGTSFHVGEGIELKNATKITHTIDYPIGASLLVKTQFIQEVGLLNEEYFLYFEELDWVLRGKQKGWNFTISIDSIADHKEGKSIGSKADKTKSDLADYWALRNRIVFTRKHYPQFLVFVYFGFCIVLFNRLRRLQFTKFKQACKILLQS